MSETLEDTGFIIISGYKKELWWTGITIVILILKYHAVQLYPVHSSLDAACMICERSKYDEWQWILAFLWGELATW